MVASCSGVILSRGPLMQAARALRSLLVCSAKDLKLRAVSLTTSSLWQLMRRRRLRQMPD
jgi:hypothetical protein